MRILLVPLIAASLYLSAPFRPQEQQPSPLEVKQPFLELGKDAYCEGSLTWPDDGKPYTAIVHLNQDDKDSLVAEAGKKHSYPFNTLDEGWLHASDVVKAYINGGQYGDNPGDSFTYRRNTKNWDVTKNVSAIGDAEKNFVKAMLSVKGCAQ